VELLGFTLYEESGFQHMIRILAAHIPV